MRLSPFSFAVLVLVGRGGAGPHDLRRMAEIGRVYWDAAPSQWYAEPKRLAEHGYLEAQKTPGPDARADALQAHRARPRGARGLGAHPGHAAADPERAGGAPARRRPRRAGGRARGPRGDAPRPRRRARGRRRRAGARRRALRTARTARGQPPLCAAPARAPAAVAGRRRERSLSAGSSRSSPPRS